MAEPILTFSDLWQEAVVGHMIDDYQFFLNCKNYLKPGWFESADVREIVRVLVQIHDQLEVKRKITHAEIDGRIAQEFLNKQDQYRFREMLIKCKTSAGMVGIDVLAKDLTTWVRIIKLHDLLATGEKLFNSRQYESAGQKIKEAVHDMMSTEFAPPVEASFKDPITFLRLRDEELKDCLTTGHPDFDENLRAGSKKPIPPGATHEYQMNLNNLTYGALAKGDSTLLVGPTNAGKTTTCVTIIAHNVKMGKNVLYVTMEQKERDIMTKLYQAYVAATSEQLSLVAREDNVNPGVTQAQLQLTVAAHAYDRHLTYVSYTDPTKMYVEDLLTLIEGLQEKRVAATGKGYDLMVVDYPGMLSSRLHMNRKSSGWEEITYVYKQMYMASKHHNVHGIYPMQTNREGYRINKGDANKMIDASDVSSGFNVTHGADNIITLNRSVEDEARGFMHFFVSKARLGKKGWTLTTKTDFAKSVTHGPHLTVTLDFTGTRNGASSGADLITQGKVSPVVTMANSRAQIVSHLTSDSAQVIGPMPENEPEPSDAQSDVVS